MPLLIIVSDDALDSVREFSTPIEAFEFYYDTYLNDLEFLHSELSFPCPLTTTDGKLEFCKAAREYVDDGIDFKGYVFENIGGKFKETDASKLIGATSVSTPTALASKPTAKKASAGRAAPASAPSKPVSKWGAWLPDLECYEDLLEDELEAAVDEGDTDREADIRGALAKRGTKKGTAVIPTLPDEDSDDDEDWEDEEEEVEDDEETDEAEEGKTIEEDVRSVLGKAVAAARVEEEKRRAKRSKKFANNKTAYYNTPAGSEESGVILSVGNHSITVRNSKGKMVTVDKLTAYVLEEE